MFSIYKVYQEKRPVTFECRWHAFSSSFSSGPPPKKSSTARQRTCQHAQRYIYFIHTTFWGIEKAPKSGNFRQWSQIQISLLVLGVRREKKQESDWLATMAFIVDRFHAPGHCGQYCAQTCLPTIGENKQLLGDFPTEIAEIVNSEMTPLGHTFRHMGKVFTQLVVNECADVHNLSRLLALRDKQGADSKRRRRGAALVELKHLHLISRRVLMRVKFSDSFHKQDRLLSLTNRFCPSFHPGLPPAPQMRQDQDDAQAHAAKGASVLHPCWSRTRCRRQRWTRVEVIISNNSLCHLGVSLYINPSNKFPTNRKNEHGSFLEEELQRMHTSFFIPSCSQSICCPRSNRGYACSAGTLTFDGRTECNDLACEQSKNVGQSRRIDSCIFWRILFRCARFFLAPWQHLQLAYVAEMGAYKALKFLPTQPMHMRFCAGFAEPSCQVLYLLWGPRRNEDVKPTFQEIPTPHTACIQLLRPGSRLKGTTSDKAA